MKLFVFACVAVVAMSHSLIEKEMEMITKDCRNDTTTKPINIDFTNAADTRSKIRACFDQDTCKPYRDCELSLASGATETITIDATVGYIIFTFYDGQEAELWPDVNMSWPTQYSIKKPAIHPTLQGLLGDSPAWEVYSTNLPDSEDPHHVHCEDVAVNTSDDHAMEWLSATSYM